MKRLILYISIVLLSCSGLWAESSNITANIIVLDVSEAQFKQQSDAAGWKTGHVMYKETNVTSSDENFWRDVQVYSNDGVPLFSVMQQVKTRALAYGYLQLANYDRENKKTTPLNKYPISYDAFTFDIPDNSPIYLDLTQEEFSSAAGENWKTFHIMINTESVTSINNSSSVSVYSRDKHLLFSIAIPAAGYVRQTATLTLANYSNNQVSKLRSIDLVP